MKTTTLFLTVLAGLMLASNAASAKGGIPIVYSNGPTFETMHQLPDSVTVDAKHVNFGVAYEQFAIFWIPIWNYGTTEYILVTDSGDEAYTLDEDDLEYISETYGIDTTAPPAISFWNKTGGKAIWGAVIALIVWGVLPSKKKDDDENAVAEG
jgi:hypothetical protein